ncbi:sulfotransferase family 2 domain-containing protein [Paracoccus litorisediminis]|uniref:Sulfotransferase family protein n=1 Tax=Paracoccus litorisediminis TaxID=2006130 RepID=A0A844HV28_9RHOB|nr:sulfotransferase family 2 domain-containing protein [Paracoccus litorisediminis]MTH62197.1 hypothetical protein [Paracoccus litorisediminis]
MPFRDLDKVDLCEYVISERKNVPFWLFMHIPKTAGSSFSESMQRLLPPYKNVQVDYADAALTHNEKINLAADNFIEAHSRSAYRSASGHMPYDLIEKITNVIPGAKTVTFLRNPVSRVVSDYRYQRTPQHPPYEDFKRRFPTIESYIESTESQNKIARFIGGRGVDLRNIDLIERIDEKFSFVGLLEMYPLSYNVIFNLFGQGGQFPIIHSRKTPDIADTKVDITEEIISKIKSTNNLDLEIYNHVSARLNKVKGEWKKYLEVGFPDEWKELSKGEVEEIEV